jgi:T3SS negative regulator,GrlR
MLEAHWTVEFRSPFDFGAGTVVFENGRLFGGDGQFSYEGNYRVDNGDIHSDVNIEHFSGQPNSVFGLKEKFQIKVSGKVQAPVMELTGHLVEPPFTPISIKCTKKTDLP